MKYPEKMRELISETVRQNIHQSGIELIREAGWSAFTTERIAERAGVSRGVLYNYYKNKEAIAHSIIEAGFAALNAKLSALAASKKSAAARLREMANLDIDHFIHERELHRVFMQNLPPPGKKKTPPPKHFHFERDRIFAAVIESGVASGEFRTVDVTAAVMLLTGALHQLCMRSIFENTEADVPGVFELWLHAVQK